MLDPGYDTLSFIKMSIIASISSSSLELLFTHTLHIHHSFLFPRFQEVFFWVVLCVVESPESSVQLLKVVSPDADRAVVSLIFLSCFLLSHPFFLVLWGWERVRFVRGCDLESSPFV